MRLEISMYMPIHTNGLWTARFYSMIGTINTPRYKFSPFFLLAFCLSMIVRMLFLNKAIYQRIKAFPQIPLIPPPEVCHDNHECQCRVASSGPKSAIISCLFSISGQIHPFRVYVFGEPRTNRNLTSTISINTKNLEKCAEERSCK